MKTKSFTERYYDILNGQEELNEIARNVLAVVDDKKFKPSESMQTIRDLYENTEAYSAIKSNDRNKIEEMVDLQIALEYRHIKRNK